MDKTLLKIIGATTVLLTSVAIISLILLQVFESEESEDLPLNNPKFATPTLVPQVKVIKTPTPIPTPNFDMISKMISLAYTPKGKTPSTLMRIVDGRCCQRH